MVNIENEDQADHTSCVRVVAQRAAADQQRISSRPVVHPVGASELLHANSDQWLLHIFQDYRLAPRRAEG